MITKTTPKTNEFFRIKIEILIHKQLNEWLYTKGISIKANDKHLWIPSKLRNLPKY